MCIGTAFAADDGIHLAGVPVFGHVMHVAAILLFFASPAIVRVSAVAPLACADPPEGGAYQDKATGDGAFVIENERRIELGWASLAAVVLVAIYYGDVYFYYTIPISVPFLLVAAAYALYRSGVDAIKLSPGLLLMLAMATVVVVQIFAGIPPTREDVGLYLPIIWAMLAISALQTAMVDTKTIWRGIAAGALFASAIMLVMVFLVPADIFLVPGQMPPDWHPKPYNADPSLTQQEWEFYQQKNLARHALGRSNYIAVFLIFAVTLALFMGGWLVALLLIIAAVFTQSRTGLFVILPGAFVLRALHKTGAKFRIVCALAMVVGLIVLAFAIGLREQLPASIVARLASLEQSIEPILNHWAIGAPRSVVMAETGLGVLWSPHSSIASLILTFGIAGFALYSAYVFIAMRRFYALGKTSPLWAGIFFGFLLLFAWSLVEIIVMTPAFELLFGTLYALSLSQEAERQGDRRPIQSL